MMGMKTLAIVKMRPLWKIASALFWQPVSMSVYKEQYTSDIQHCIYLYKYTHTHTQWIEYNP